MTVLERIDRLVATGQVTHLWLKPELFARLVREMDQTAWGTHPRQRLFEVTIRGVTIEPRRTEHA